MKVTARPQLVCGKCGPCRKGQYNACTYLKVEGFQAPGAAQELFIVTEDRVAILPEHLTLEEGAMVEPSAVGAHATGRSRNLAGNNVVVSGAGTIGNLVAQFAKVRGAKKVLITDLSDFRLNLAEKCGIDGILNVSKTSFEEGIKNYFGDEGFQVGFEAAGNQSSLDVLMQFIEKGGEIILIGVYSKDPVVNMYFLGEHELDVYGSMMYRHDDYECAIDMIANRKINALPLHTCSFPFEKFHEAYEFIENQGDHTLKVMIDL